MMIHDRRRRLASVKPCKILGVRFSPDREQAYVGLLWWHGTGFEQRTITVSFERGLQFHRQVRMQGTNP